MAADCPTPWDHPAPCQPYSVAAVLLSSSQPHPAHVCWCLSVYLQLAGTHTSSRPSGSRPSSSNHPSCASHSLALPAMPTINQHHATRAPTQADVFLHLLHSYLQAGGTHTSSQRNGSRPSSSSLPFCGVWCAMRTVLRMSGLLCGCCYI